jgi:hypothetical protein
MSTGLAEVKSGRGELKCSLVDMLINKSPDLIPIYNSLSCNICGDISARPVNFNCGCSAIYCVFCAENHKNTQKKQHLIIKCPNCNIRVDNYSTNGVAKSQINSFRIMCVNSNMGCNWQGFISDLDQHIHNHCMFKIFTCCGIEMNRVEFNDHNMQHSRKILETSIYDRLLFEEQMDIWKIRHVITHSIHKRYRESIFILEDLCKNRNPNALSLLAHHYAKGLGVDVDFQEAFNLYTLAAKQKNPQALYILAYAYASGKGCDVNWGTSFDLLLESAKLGNSAAQYSIGVLFEGGDVIGRNLDLAFNYFKSAASKGHKQALFKIARYYEYSEIDEVKKLSKIERKRLANEALHDYNLRMNISKNIRNV